MKNACSVKTSLINLNQRTSALDSSSRWSSHMVCSNYAVSHTIHTVKHIPTWVSTKTIWNITDLNQRIRLAFGERKWVTPRSYSQVSGRADIETQTESLLMVLSHTPGIDILSFKVSCEMCKQTTINVVYSIK